MEEPGLPSLQNDLAGMAAPTCQLPIYIGPEETDIWISDL